jgi:hypothetical protein
MGGDASAAQEVLAPLGPPLAGAANIDAGGRVFDVAAGSGNISIPAAMAGAPVVSSDLTPELRYRFIGENPVLATTLDNQFVEFARQHLTGDDPAGPKHSHPEQHFVTPENIARRELIMRSLVFAALAFAAVGCAGVANAAPAPSVQQPGPPGKPAFDPHVPNTAEGWCPGGGVGGFSGFGYCDGDRYPDGSYWHQVRGKAPFAGSILTLTCVVDPDGGPLPPLAPPGGCGGVV